MIANVGVRGNYRMVYQRVEAPTAVETPKPVVIEKHKLHRLGHLLPLAILPSLLLSTVAFAAPEAIPASTTEDMILRAFDPLIKMVISLSYPIAGIMIASGCLMVMVQQKEKGYSILQNAAIGYILVQLSPLFLKLLVGVGMGLVI